MDYIKYRVTAEVNKMPLFQKAVYESTGMDAKGQAQNTLYTPFNADLYCARGLDGVSVADVFTALPLILAERQKRASRTMNELVTRFLAFRTDFVTLCHPLE